MGSLCIMFKEYKAIFTFCLCLCSLLDVFNFWKRVNASDEIIWRTPCSTSADPLGVADPRWKTPALELLFFCLFAVCFVHNLNNIHTCFYSKQRPEATNT